MSFPGLGYPHYPPCYSDGCTSRQCCAEGLKYAWPELVGWEFPNAKATIEKDNPRVTAVPLKPGYYTTGDFCCNRVWVPVDEHGRVIRAPIVG